MIALSNLSDPMAKDNERREQRNACHQSRMYSPTCHVDDQDAKSVIAMAIRGIVRGGKCPADVFISPLGFITVMRSTSGTSLSWLALMPEHYAGRYQISGALGALADCRHCLDRYTDSGGPE